MGLLCTGVSRNGESCELVATVRCETCGRWFCAGHAENEEWHLGMMLGGDEGGEA